MEPSKQDYEQVAAECSKGVKSSGLWAQAIAEAGGMNDQTLARYIQLRVTEIAQVRAAKIQATVEQAEKEGLELATKNEHAEAQKERASRATRKLEEQEEERHQEALRRRDERRKRERETLLDQHPDKNIRSESPLKESPLKEYAVFFGLVFLILFVILVVL